MRYMPQALGISEASQPVSIGKRPVFAFAGKDASYYLNIGRRPHEVTRPLIIGITGIIGRWTRDSSREPEAAVLEGDSDEEVHPTCLGDRPSHLLGLFIGYLNRVYGLFSTEVRKRRTLPFRSESFRGSVPPSHTVPRFVSPPDEDHDPTKRSSSPEEPRCQRAKTDWAKTAESDRNLRTALVAAAVMAVLAGAPNRASAMCGMPSGHADALQQSDAGGAEASRTIPLKELPHGPNEPIVGIWMISQPMPPLERRLTWCSPDGLVTGWNSTRISRRS